MPPDELSNNFFNLGGPGPHGHMPPPPLGIPPRGPPPPPPGMMRGPMPPG